MSMTESADGLSVAATRQCAGRAYSLGGAAAPPRPPPRPRPAGVAAAPAPAAPPRPAPSPPARPASPRPPPRAPPGATTGPPGAPPGPGTTYGPAATSCADVMVVLGSESVRRDSHGADCASAASSETAVTVIMARYCSALPSPGLNHEAHKDL